VLAEARRQGVLPLLLERLEGAAPDVVPAALRTRLHEVTRHIARWNLEQTAALLAALDELDQHGIRALPFKGPTLAIQAYGSTGRRWFADLDLLVHPADLSAARDALLGLGFRPTYPGSPARRRLLVRHGSHETFERADGVTVELHWRIAAPVSEFHLDYDRLWGRLGTLYVGGRSVPALPADDLLLVLSIHGTKHAWERLAWICDVAYQLRAAPDLDWDALFAEAERMRAERIVALAIHLARTLLEAPIPRFVARRIDRDSTIGSLAAHVERGLFLPPRAGAGTFRFHVATRSGIRDKLGLALGSLTALNQHDLDVVRLPDAALPLYYLTRPLRLAGKSLRHLFLRGRPA
jgi:hypothetical protein